MNFISEIDEILGRWFENTVLENVIQQSVDSYHDELFKRTNDLQITLTPVIFQKNGDSEEKCFICLEFMKEGEAIYELPCKHQFHKECLDNAVSFQHKQCPICRQNIQIVQKNDSNTSSGHIITYE